MNATFKDAGGDKFIEWRLFQLAFILAQIAGFASRLPSYEDDFDVERDEETASLLYFATGGGKSEAFFGALVYLLFLDRFTRKEIRRQCACSLSAEAAHRSASAATVSLAGSSRTHSKVS